MAARPRLRDTPPTRRVLSVALGLGLLVVLLAVPQLGSFGPSWDLVNAEYDYGEQYLAYWLSGDGAYLDFHHELDEAGARPASVRQPHPDFRVVRAPPATVYPLGATLSALACELLWTRAGWMSAMAAHHLPVVLFLAALLAVLCAWGTRRAGWAAGFGAVAAAVVSPRLFQDGFWNLKDFPEACLYTWAWLAVLWAAGLTETDTSAPDGARSPSRERTGRWLVVALLTGLALAQKGNALVLPAQALLLWLVLLIVRRQHGEPLPVLPWRSLLLAVPVTAAVCFALTPYFREDTLRRVAEHVEFLRSMSQAVAREDVWAGVRQAALTTPPVVLGLALLGLWQRRVPVELRLALLIGVAVPVGRTLLPSARVHDGVRLFLEFAPPLCLLAGFGFALLARALRRTALVAVAVLALFGPAVVAAAAVWPYGHCYYNAFAGGLSGARAAGLDDAHDYWALSYWHGLAWLSQHAEADAQLLVPIADHVVAAAAPVRLRADLRLLALDDVPSAAPLYVMSITRSGPHFAVTEDLAAGPAPLHTLSVQGAPILNIVRIDDPARTAQLHALWVAARRDPLRALKPLLFWLHRQGPEALQRAEALAAQIPERGLPAVLDELREWLPPHLHAAAADWLQRQPPAR